MLENSEDSQALLRAHKIGTLNVDWLINARNLNTEGPGSSEAKDSESKSKAKSKSNSEIKDGGNTKTVKERTGSNELAPEGPSHINTNLPEQRSVEEQNQNRGRRNSAMAAPSSSESRESDSSTELRKTKSLSAASPGPGASTRLRRTSVSGGGSNNGSPKKEKKMGFFKSLFTSKKKKSSTAAPSFAVGSSHRGTAPSSRRSSITSNTFGLPLARSRTYSAAQGEAYQHENQSHDHHHHELSHHHDSQANSAPLKDGSVGISRVKTQSTRADDYNGRDRRLMEFLEYYKAHGYAASAFRERDDSENMEMGAKPSVPVRVSSLAVVIAAVVIIRMRPIVRKGVESNMMSKEGPYHIIQEDLTYHQLLKVQEIPKLISNPTAKTILIPIQNQRLLHLLVLPTNLDLS